LEIIKDNEINITEKEWEKLNNDLSRDEIKHLISTEIEKYKIPVPLKKITEDDALNDFINICKTDTKPLICEGEWGTRYNYKYELTNKYINLCNKGNKSSNYFHQNERYKCDSINAPSPYRTWGSYKFRSTLFNSFWTLKFKKINSDNIRTALALRKFISSQFRVSAAKCIYEYFGSESVLDTSCGWGDRLSAFLATKKTKYYYGTDPNTNLHEGYNNQIKLYNTDKTIKIERIPSEELVLPEDTFDLLFTSPPYFDVERYTKDLTQSWKRYKNLEVWLNKFLFESIKRGWVSLRKGGVCAINISDVYAHHRINKLCDPMNDFIATLPNSNYEGCIGLRMPKRPRSKAVDSVNIFCEPIWIWRKG